MQSKSQKELAFLHDLYIATDWGERFAELVDEHVELPKEGRVLYLAAGTGGYAMSLQERGGEKFKLLCVDDDEERLELARAKAVALNEQTEFQRENLSALSFADDQFDLVLGDASLSPLKDLNAVINEMVRVAMPGAFVAWWLPTASSFGEFFSIYWEALQRAGLENHSIDVENLITERPTVSDAESWAEDAGLEDVSSWTAIEEFDYESGEEFLSSPLITDFLLHTWFQNLSQDERPRVLKEIARIIDEDRHERDFALSMKATLIVGRKSRVQ